MFCKRSLSSGYAGIDNLRAGRTGTAVLLGRVFFNAYLAEYRVYDGYDLGLKTGPYNFGFVSTRPNWVEHFPYQDGLLVWYYDTSFPDNNVGDNCASGRCGGLVLPVDAHPDLMLRPDGQVWRPRIQSYDSTFGLDRTDVITLHANSVAQTVGGLPANPKFDDRVSGSLAAPVTTRLAGAELYTKEPQRVAEATDRRHDARGETTDQRVAAARELAIIRETFGKAHGNAGTH